MDEISSDQLKQDISDILQGSDITTVTSKKIRKQLEEKYHCDLIDRKAEIDQICMDEIVNITSKKSKANGADENDEASGSEEEEEEEPAHKKAKSSKTSSKSKHSSEDEDDGGLDDEDLARKLQEEEEENGSRKTRHGNKPQKQIKKKRKKPKSSEDESNDEDSSSKKKKKSKGTGRTNKYTEPCYLSPQLADIMQETRLKRSDVVKKMWQIVKERNLYDPKNKQFMICDEQMQTVFGCKRVRIFGMMKVLKNHIFSPDEYEGMRS